MHADSVHSVQTMPPKQDIGKDGVAPLRRGRAISRIPRIVRVAAWALGGVLLLAVAGAVGARWYLGRSIQPRAGAIEVAGLSAPAHIAFDEWAIPRIRAATERDALRAQGFVHASERLWQLEMYQRVAQGRLAELFGEPALGADQLLRTLDLWGAAGRELATLPPPMLDLLEAYAEGVNARIASWRGAWPPEFIILGVEPQPWSPQASLAIARIMTFDLAKWQGELDRIEALSRLPATHRAALSPRYPDWGPTILQDAPGESGGMAGGAPPHEKAPENVTATPVEAASPGMPRSWAQDRIMASLKSAATPADAGRGARDAPPLDPLGLLSGLGLTASNSWVLGPSRTADGHPLLANDTHLGLRAPSTWYLNAISIEESGRHTAGFSIPGAPAIVIGLSRRMAWGFTNGSVDGADFIAETVSEDGSRYLDGEAWRAFDVRHERIHVRGREQPVDWNVRHTVRGPIITDAIPTGGLVLSMLWTGFLERGPFPSLLNINRARTAEEMHEAGRGFSQPHQNLLYASVSGSVGYRLTGSVPLRPDSAVGPVVSLPEAWPRGWTDYLDEDSFPAWIDPPSGYIATANNLQSRAAFGRLAKEYFPPFRAKRIDETVSRASGWTLRDMRRLQRDSKSLWAGVSRRRAVAAARRIGEEDLAAALADWDLTLETGSSGAVPFFVWLYRLRALIAADELGEDGAFPGFAFAHMLEEGDAPGTQLARWADDVRTPEIEPFAQWEEEAARTAAPFADVPWGAAHFERSAHPLGSVAWLDRLFSFHVGPYPAPGGPYTLRASDRSSWSPLDATSWSPPWIGESGVSQRFAARMAPDAPEGYFFLPTGQSGNPLDKHYRDMADRWDEGFLVQIVPGERLDSPEHALELLPPAQP